jgi:dienelactone hydrolase
MSSIYKTALAVGAVAALITVGASCTRPAAQRPAAAGMVEATAENGPAPTAASVAAARGSFQIATASVPAGQGFGGGTVYYPTQDGTYGVIASLPGFLNGGNVMAPYGQKLASNGFVVVVANTNTVLDFPAQRANQVLAALDWVMNRSTVAAKIDKTRIGVFGYSMGGGGSLDAAKRNPAIKAVVGMAPWNIGTTYGGTKAAGMIVACTGDVVAPPASMGRPFYTSLTGPKAYFEITAGNHACPLASTSPIGTRTLVWMKRFVDDDQRYQQFLCPQPVTVSGATGWQSANVCS